MRTVAENLRGPSRKRRRQEGQEGREIRSVPVPDSCATTCAMSEYQLSYDEAAYLCDSGQIGVVCKGVVLTHTACWRRLCQLRRNLPYTYAAYCHWRKLGWIPRCGLQ